MNYDFWTVDPMTGENICGYYYYANLNELAQRASDCQDKWKTQSLPKRLKFFPELIASLLKHRERAAQLMQQEMGKPLAQGLAEVDKCALLIEYYLENSLSFLQPKMIDLGDNKKGEIYAAPLGVILGIMPWNFPFWQVFRFAVPNIVLGNTVLVKHATSVAGCALLIEEIFNEAFEEPVYINVFADHQPLADLIESDSISGVSLTGSEKAGAAIAKKAGECLKKCVFELGGSDPYLILDDADLELASIACLKGRFVNSGQSCIAAKRFIVTAKNHDDFVKKLYDKMNPLDIEVGPMARQELRDQLAEQVSKSINLGAKCLIGGEKGRGAYYSPTLLVEVKEGMPAYSEELFGPVAVVIEVKDEDEAFRVANSTQFGLGGAIFSKDLDRARMLARTHLDTGSIAINDFVKSNPQMPFGGIKKSGYGREMAEAGLLEFANIKSIVFS